jgi:hypothetical protein
MALIYEKVPLFKVVKTWDNNDPKLSEVYKLQSNDSHNKSRVKIHKDNGKYGIDLPLIKPSRSSTREQKNATLTGQTLLESSRMCSRAITERPGNRCFTSTFRSPSMQLRQYRLCRIAVWKKTPSSNSALYPANA